MEKVLYFEGAGMDFYSDETNYSDVGNFRIRTAFKNLDGVEYYIELGRAVRTNTKGKVSFEWALRIDHLFKIEDRHKEELNLGGYELKRNYKEIRELDYTKEDITKWINENLNCNFKTIKVLHNFYGYRVHTGDGNYNLMEDINLDHKRADKRKEAYENTDMEYRKALDEKYSKIGLLEMDSNSITIRCHASESAMNNTDLPRVKRIAI